MCNLSEGIWEKAMKEGIKEGMMQGRTKWLAEGRAEGEAGGIIKGLAEGFKAIMSQGKSFDETAVMLNVTADTKQKVHQLLKELGTI